MSALSKHEAIYDRDYVESLEDQVAMQHQRNDSTEYIVEYRFEEEDEWLLVDTYEHLADARHRLVDHVQTYHHANCRIREVTEVRKIEEQIVGEYIVKESVR